MTILSDKGNRSLIQNLTPFKPELVNPTGAETRSSAYEFVQDEERSSSWSYNNQMYQDRFDTVRGFVEEGIDLRNYQGTNGVFNYNRFAEETGLVKTDRELAQEKSDLLSIRRQKNQDIMARGGGGSKFLGMAGSYMTDPLNFNQLLVPVGSASVAVQSMSTLAKSLYYSRNVMGVALVAETGIQATVYQHKQNIESPYTKMDAIKMVGITTLSAGILTGGLTAGISSVGSYFAKSSNAIANQPQLFPRAPMAYKSPLAVDGKPIGLPTLENIGKLETKLLQDARADLLTKAGATITRGERKSLVAQLKVLAKQLNDADLPEIKYGKDGKPLAPKPVSKSKTKKAQKLEKNRQAAIKAEKALIQGNIDRINKVLAKDRASALAEQALVRIESGKTLPAKQQKQLDDYITANTTPETEAVFALSRWGDAMRTVKGPTVLDDILGGYGLGKEAGLDAASNKAALLKSLEDKIVKANKNTTTVDGVVQKNKTAQQLEKLRDLIAKTSDDDLEGLMTDLFRKNVAEDLRLMQAREDAFNLLQNTTLKPEDFVGPPTAPSSKAPATSLERQALEEAGLGSAFDAEVARYNSLQSKLTIDGDDLLDAQAVIKTLDEELDQLENILRCTRG